MFIPLFLFAWQTGDIDKAIGKHNPVVNVHPFIPIRLADGRYWQSNRLTQSRCSCFSLRSCFFNLQNVYFEVCMVRAKVVCFMNYTSEHINQTIYYFSVPGLGWALHCARVRACMRLRVHPHDFYRNHSINQSINQS